MRIFKNPFFIITLAITVFIGTASLVMHLTGRTFILDDAVGTVLMPFEKAGSAIGSLFDDIGQYFKDYNDLKKENESLKKTIADLTDEVESARKLKRENDWLYDYLGLMRSDIKYELQNGEIVAYDQLGYMASFTVDKGSFHGIKAGMPVITEKGLIGCVTSVGANYAICTATSNPSFGVSVYVERTVGEGDEAQDVKVAEGLIAQGNFDYAPEGKAVISYLDEDTKIAPGDRVKTSGSGEVYPRGICVGTVESIEADPLSQTLFAVIKLDCDVENTKEVMIIKSFAEVMEDAQ